MYEQNLSIEFERQVQNLVDKNYPEFAGITEQELRTLAQSLQTKLGDLQIDSENGIPFLLVVSSSLVSSEHAMSKVVANKQQGSVIMTPVKPTDFQEIEGVEIPNAQIYLITSVDTGREFLNISPEDCLRTIHTRGRTPLTLDEGVALVTHFPEVLTDKEKYNCIQMPGSRKPGDQRVPSIWMSYKKPRLGWCWDRNIHTWLGSASASDRVS